MTLACNMGSPGDFGRFALLCAAVPILLAMLSSAAIGLGALAVTWLVRVTSKPSRPLEVAPTTRRAPEIVGILPPPWRGGAAPRAPRSSPIAGRAVHLAQAYPGLRGPAAPGIVGRSTRPRRTFG